LISINNFSLFKKGRAICDLSGLVRMQGFGETNDILRLHANDAAARAVNVRYEKKRDRRNKR